ncbi:MAG: inositol monophosphatase, partial [Candidatus Methanomethylophilaceae archaeon]|nr:inositol monophosphatase [Candidatus Methanomethylophilaceae archaeon]
ALFVDGEPRLGVVHNPFTGDVYSAVTGEGAYLNGKRIHVSDRPLPDCMFATAWCAYGKELSEGCFEVSRDMYRRCNDIRRIGTAALELCLLAQGAIDLYFEIRLSPWDHAAALICVK